MRSAIPSSCCSADRPLLAGADQSADQLLPLERLGPAVLLDHAVLDLLDVLATGVALAAAETLAPAADAVTFLALARVDDLVAEMPAEGAFHAASPPAISRIRPSERPSRAMKTRPSSVTGTNDTAHSTIAAPTAVRFAARRRTSSPRSCRQLVKAAHLSRRRHRDADHEQRHHEERTEIAERHMKRVRRHEDSQRDRQPQRKRQRQRPEQVRRAAA